LAVISILEYSPSSPTRSQRNGGAASSIPRDQAFAIFLGTSSESTTAAGAFMQGLHTAFVVSMAFLVVTIVLSLIRGKEDRSR